MENLLLGKLVDICQTDNCGQNFLGRVCGLIVPTVRNRSALPLAVPLRSDVEPVSSRTKVLADHGPIRLALYVDRQFSRTLPVAVSDLAEVADTCLATLGKSLLLSDRQVV